MSPKLEIQKTDSVPEDSRVCHYDELAPPAKERLPSLINHEMLPVDKDVIDGLNCCEIVKFIDYYEISVHGVE